MQNKHNISEMQDMKQNNIVTDITPNVNTLKEYDAEQSAFENPLSTET